MRKDLKISCIVFIFLVNWFIYKLNFFFSLPHLIHACNVCKCMNKLMNRVLLEFFFRNYSQLLKRKIWYFHIHIIDEIFFWCFRKSTFLHLQKFSGFHLNVLNFHAKSQDLRVGFCACHSRHSCFHVDKICA